jgi:hypothetical protein
MKLLRTVLLALAALCFLLAALNVTNSSKVNLVSLGLFVLALAELSSEL